MKPWIRTPIKVMGVDSTNAFAEELNADLQIEVPDELYEIYREEAEDHIAQIYAGLNELKERPDDKEQLQSVRRSAHTLKGAAAAVGVRLVARLSHRMEDLLDWLYDNGAPLTSERLVLLLDTTDCLHDLSFEEFDREEVVRTVSRLYGLYEQNLPSEEKAVAESDEAKGGGEQAPETDAGTAESRQAEPSQFNEPQTDSQTNAQKGSASGAQPSPASADRDQESSQQATTPSAAKGDADKQQMLRVPLRRIDDVVRTVSELIINRTTFEQRMGDLTSSVAEMEAILERLRSVAHEMESRHSVDALNSGSPSTLRRGNGENDVEKPVR